MPVSGSRDDRLSAIARLQRGRVSRKQLLAAGISSSAIGRLLARGHLLHRYRAVYAVGHTAPAPLAAETAALLACGDHAVLSQRTAAVLWRLVPDGDGMIHITIRGRHGAQPNGVTLHRAKALSRSELRVVQQLPVTSPARTLLDIAESVDLRTLERAVEEALTQKLVSEQQLRAVALKALGRRGARRLTAVLDADREPSITRSRAERRFRDLLRAAQLPEPLVNAPRSRLHGRLLLA